MNTFKKLFVSTIAVVGILAFSPITSHAIIGIGGTGVLGEYSGTLDYSFTNSTTASLTVVLNNDSDVGNSGFITAFAFNNPGGLITDVTSLDSSNNNFEDILGGATFSNDVNGAPFGQFDIGATTGGNWEGGPNVSAGIAAGGSANFLFSFTGINGGLQNLTDASFINTLSVGPGDGEGHEDFLVRFRGFTLDEFGQEGGSDKVPNDGGCVRNCEPVVPEPATMVLFGSGLLGSVLARRKRQ